MTERDLGNGDSGRWYGKVVSVKDPDQSGRVQVRIFGRHDDEENIPDDDLPWVMPTQPVTSAALGKVGTSPLGLLKGSHVQGYWSDRDHQIPVMTGSFGKSGEYKNKGALTDGVPEIDIDKGSMPTASTNQSPPVDINPFSKLYKERITINDINNGVKTVKDITRSTGIVNKKAVDEKLKQPKIPTTASVDKSNTGDVLNIIKKADPSSLSATLPNMVGSFSSVRSIMNLTSSTGLTNLLNTGLQGAIGSMAGGLGLNNIIGPLMSVLNSGLLKGPAQQALKMALLSSIRAGSASNMPRVISRTTPVYNPNIGRPLDNLIVLPAKIPPTYVQSYYPVESEPYPGYIEWMNPDNRQYVLYTERRGEPHYASAEEHIAGQTALATQTAMLPIMRTLQSRGSNPRPTELVAMAGIIAKALDSTQSLGISKILGNGANMSNMVKLASKLIPAISGKIDGVMNGHLPKSVLDQAKVAKTMNEFTKNQALLKKKKDSMKEAMKPDTAKQDSAFKEYVDKKVSIDLAKAAPGTTVSVSVPLADGTTYTKTVTK